MLLKLKICAKVMLAVNVDTQDCPTDWKTGILDILNVLKVMLVCKAIL